MIDGMLRINQETLLQGLEHLGAVDPDLAAIIDRLGSPPLWERQPGFPTLVHIILEQQVSLASAASAFQKLQTAAGSLTATAFLAFSDEQLKRFGFSRQKAGYCRELAARLLEGSVDLEALESIDDQAARARLMELRGIGPWSADIYLLMALRRADIWPEGDLALKAAVQQVKALPGDVDQQGWQALSEDWKPWRSVAARVFWMDYLDQHGRYQPDPASA